MTPSLIFFIASSPDWEKPQGEAYSVPARPGGVKSFPARLTAVAPEEEDLPQRRRDAEIRRRRRRRRERRRRIEPSSLSAFSFTLSASAPLL
jgi:hypothetical protein